MNFNKEENSFIISVENFSGSIQKLLEMVQKRKMSISDISLATVADEYVQYVKDGSNIPENEMADFVVVASTLLLIKSRALLPQFKLEAEEEEDIRDFERRVALYQIYTQASNVLDEYQKIVVPFISPSRQIKHDIEISFDPPTTGLLNIDLLHSTIDGVMNDFTRDIDVKQTANIDSILSIDDVIASLAKRLENNAQLTFSQIISEHGKEKYVTLVHFLALLELVKDSNVTAHQNETYGDIEFMSC